jgi:hypothetical protein
VTCSRSPNSKRRRGWDRGGQPHTSARRPSHKASSPENGLSNLLREFLGWLSNAHLDLDHGSASRLALQVVKSTVNVTGAPWGAPVHAAASDLSVVGSCGPRQRVVGADGCLIASKALDASAHARSSFSSSPIRQWKRRRSRSGGPRSAMMRMPRSRAVEQQDARQRFLCAGRQPRIKPSPRAQPFPRAERSRSGAHLAHRRIGQL